MASEDYSKPPYPRRVYLQPRSAAEFKRAAPKLRITAAILALAIAAVGYYAFPGGLASITGFSLAAAQEPAAPVLQKTEFPLYSVFFSNPVGGFEAYSPSQLEKNDGQLAEMLVKNSIEYAEFSFQSDGGATGGRGLEQLQLVVSWKASGDVIAEVQAYAGAWTKACTAEITEFFSTYHCDLSKFAGYYENSGWPFQIRVFFVSEKAVSVALDRISLQARLE